MMALTIVSVGIMALVQSAQTGAQTATALQQNTGAYHVADQVMMVLYQKPNLQVGTHRGEEVLNGQTYYWQGELKTTDNIHINRIDLVVGLDRKLDYTQASITGFRKRN